MKSRPAFLPGFTIKKKTGCGNLYTTLSFCDGKPFEAFTKLGKAGGCATSQTESIGRLISLCLRSDLALSDVIKQLKAVNCNRPCDEIASCSDAIGKSLEEIQADVEAHRK